MDRIIIIAPPEIDVSAAVETLKSDDVEISIVAPSPANFLHLALGMIPDHPNDGKVNDENEDNPTDESEKQENASEKNDEEPVEKPEVEEKPETESEENGEKEETNEAVFVGECIINGEKIKTFVTTSDTPYIEVENLSIGLKNTFRINESSFSFWNTSNESLMQQVFYISHNEKIISSILEVKKAENSEPRLFLTANQISILIQK